MRLPSITVMTRDCSACGAAYKLVHDEKLAGRIGSVIQVLLAGQVQPQNTWNNNDIVQEAGSQSMTSIALPSDPYACRRQDQNASRKEPRGAHLGSDWTGVSPR